MTYYSDLSPYAVRKPVTGELRPLTSAFRVLSIGWLDRAHPFPVGDTPEEFKNKLRDLCLPRNKAHHTRDFHICDLDGCPVDALADAVGFEDPSGTIGDGEVRIAGADAVYAAPALVYHYVVAHHYRPPDEFIEAVLHEQEPAEHEAEAGPS